MDINGYKLYAFYSLNRICGDVYHRLDYEAHVTDETMCFLKKHGAMIYKNSIIIICI